MIVRKLEAWIIWKSKIENESSIIAIIGSIIILSNEDTMYFEPFAQNVTMCRGDSMALSYAVNEAY